MPTSARWEVANSLQIPIKIGASCRGDVGIAPYATRRDVSFIIVGADAHVGPSVIGIVLQIPRLPTGKGFQNLGFGALLVTFPA